MIFTKEVGKLKRNTHRYEWSNLIQPKRFQKKKCEGCVFLHSKHKSKDVNEKERSPVCKLCT